MSDIILGIDLGNTNSRVAIPARPGSGADELVEVIPDDKGRKTTPSVVMEDFRGNIVVGWGAKLSAGRRPKPIFFIRRYMGTDHTERLQGRDCTPEEISAETLKYLRQMTADFLKLPVEQVRKAVICVPAYFDLSQSQATKKAGELAGLEVVSVLPEPLAAALAYVINDHRPTLKIFCYDLGGGTFDATVLEKQGGELKVLAYGGDHYLGGCDFDKLLANHLIGKLKADGYRLDLDPAARDEDDALYQSFLLAAEKYKHRLSEELEVRVLEVDFKDQAGNAMIIDLFIERKTFENLIRGETEVEMEELFHDYKTKGLEQRMAELERQIQDKPASIKKTMYLSMISLMKSGLLPQDLDEIIMVGGSSHIPMVAAELAELFGKPPTLKDSEAIVAKGAALMAAMLMDVEGEGVPRLDTLEEMKRRFWELRDMFDIALEVVTDPNEKMRYRKNGRNLIRDLERELLHHPPIRPKIASMLLDLEHLIKKMNATKVLQPSLDAFQKKVKTAYELDKKEGKYATNIPALQEEGEKAYEKKDVAQWKLVNEGLNIIIADLEEEYSRSLPPPEILAPLLKKKMMEDVRELSLIAQERNVEAEYAGRIAAFQGKVGGVDVETNPVEAIRKIVGLYQNEYQPLYYDIAERRLHGLVSGLENIAGPSATPYPSKGNDYLTKLYFTAFYPEIVRPRDVGKIIAYAHQESLVKEVTREAANRLYLPRDVQMRIKSEKPERPVSRDSVIKVSPEVSGLVFDKNEAIMTLWEDKQSVEFRFRPRPDYYGRSCHGFIHFWLEGLTLAAVPVTIFVAEEETPDFFREALAEINARPYRYIFPSYSHQDARVVELLEGYARVTGDYFLRDVTQLRAGQRWQEELRQFIQKADIFQLFWSENAAASVSVAQEWRQALEERQARSDLYFLRPVYWTEKAEPPPIPSELQEIHFVRLPYNLVD